MNNTLQIETVSKKVVASYMTYIHHTQGSQASPSFLKLINLETPCSNKVQYLCIKSINT
jgi:hypothetical protein